MNKLLPENESIFQNQNGWDALNKSISVINPSKIFVLTDENTHIHCLPYYLTKQNSNKPSEIITIPAGEKHKTIHTCLKVWEELSDKGADRDSLIINLGGGVVTDLGGFVASTFKRGLTFINIPTSLLAMVDASVGGKNGVDLGHIKNQVGVINNPHLVIVDTLFLKTLPAEHMTSGLAEMLKHGLIHSSKYWESTKNADFEKTSEFEELIWESIKIKSEIVTQDPLEKNLRKTLNYGHTLGHAIESYRMDNPHNKSLLHGEAVAIGLILATYISSELLNFPKNRLNEITECLLRHFPKQSFNQNEIEDIIKLLIFDKKNKNGQVLFVLLEDIGKHKTDCTVSNELIFKAFAYYKNF